ncbi:MAG TPA: S41 family peptidase, partial [Rubricoccaceae bacterium]
MSRLSLLALALALLTSAPDTPAQPAPLVHEAADPVAPFRRLVGDWTGTLIYTDYQDDATRVGLGVRIGVAEQRDALDASVLEFRYAYTEPDGRAVEGGRDLLGPGTDPARLSFGDYEWTVVGRDTTGGRLQLVIEREGDDNDRPATIRETLTAGTDAWALLKEVRYTGTDAFFERHTYALRRPATWISGAALRADAAVLRRAFEALHPGLYRYATPAETGARFDALAAVLTRGATLPDAYLALARMLATIRCGHTYPNFSNQNERVTEAVVTAGRRLPLYGRWTGGALVVTRDLAGNGLPPGTEILAVDGVPADTLLAWLLPLARADGSLDATRVATLNVIGASRYESLDVYLPLLFILGETVALDLRDPLTGARRSVRVPTMTAAEREAVREADARTAGGTPGVGWTVRDLGAETALLTMPSWATFNSGWDWRAFVDSTFDALAARGTPRLVIDLRGNEGGESVGDAILARLADREIAVAAFERIVRYRTVPDDLRPVLDTWDRSFDDWGDATVPRGDGTYRLTRYDDGAVVRPRGTRYAGRVAVIVGADNSSATSEFARTLRQAGLGVLVGQTTGGNQRGLNGGAFYFLRLPNSGIEVDLPLIAAVPPGGADAAPDAGLAPDVPAETGAADLARGVDAAGEVGRACLGGHVG